MKRAFFAGCGMAALSAAIFAWFWRDAPGHPDFDQFYAGAVALRQGSSPYGLKNLYLPHEWPTRLLYPLPALLVVMPLTWLHSRVAGAVFVALSGFALGIAFEKSGNRWRFATVGSRAFITCVAAGQWTVLLLSSAWLPVVGCFAAAKPNVGAIVAARWRRWQDFVPTVIAGFVLLLASFIVRPSWFGEWRSALGSAPYERAPILYPGGVLALATVLRWRRPEARFLLAYACIPQTPGPYSDLLLFAIPRSKWELLGLAMLSHVAMWIFNHLPALPTLLDRLMRYGGISTMVLMLPCVLMVLVRPNAGPPQPEVIGHDRQAIGASERE